MITTSNSSVKRSGLVHTTKVYSGLGADIVMESITLKKPNERYRCYQQ